MHVVMYVAIINSVNVENKQRMEELLDYYIAQTLQVSLEEYVNKIEKTTFGRAEVIISACMGDDEEQHEKARRIFKLIL